MECGEENLNLEWSAPKDDFGLPLNHIALWRIHVPSAVEYRKQYRSVLNQEERARADSFRDRKGELTFTVARAALKCLLSRFTGIVASRIEVQTSPTGKPYIPSIHFNLSHSRDYALLAFSRQSPLGVDLEFQRGQFDYMRIAKRYFEETARAALEGSASEAEARELFFALWTRKEAYAKACGRGVFHATAQSVGTCGEEIVLSAADDGDWILNSFNPAQGYSAAICIKDAMGKIDAYTWDPSTFFI